MINPKDPRVLKVRKPQLRGSLLCQLLIANWTVTFLVTVTVVLTFNDKEKIFIA